MKSNPNVFPSCSLDGQYWAFKLHSSAKMEPSLSKVSLKWMMHHVDDRYSQNLPTMQSVWHHLSWTQVYQGRKVMKTYFAAFRPKTFETSAVLKCMCNHVVGHSVVSELMMRCIETVVVVLFLGTSQKCLDIRCHDFSALADYNKDMSCIFAGFVKLAKV